jgi:phenylacetate-CoA ligase
MLSWISRHLVYPFLDRGDGPPRLELLRELEVSQWLPPDALRARQRERLLGQLEHAVRTVPFYSERYSAAGFALDPGELLNCFSALPIVEKSDIRQHLELMLSTAVPQDRLRTAKTGGSTSTALELRFDADCQAHRVAAAWRSDGWAGWRPGDARAALWGNPPVANSTRAKLRSLLADRTFYLDTVLLNERSMTRFYKEYQRRRPPVIFGHSHSIYILARFLEERGLTPRPPRGIVSTSMMLLQSERACIERAFGCAVTDRYGCEEVGLIASQCERHSGLHVNVDHVIVELLSDDGMPVPAGTPGQVVVTDLMNRGMPLIRYRLGDIAVASDRSCECGRGQPILTRIVGRTADFLVRLDGGLVAGVSLIERTLTKLPGIQQMQLVQEEAKRIVVNLVVGPGYTEATERALLAEFEAAFGPGISFQVARVQSLERTAAGKYRFSVCKLPRANGLAVGPREAAQPGAR